MTNQVKFIKPGTTWDEVYARAMALAPGAFEKDRINNLWGGEWQRVGTPHNAVSSIDGSSIIGPSMLDAEEAHVALMACVKEHEVWSKVDLQERKERVARAIAKLRANEEVLALLLVWEIGKPFRQAMTSVDRTIGGVEWYLENIDRMMEGRKPLSGPVSNIASWNYPLSVLAHAMFVQMLAGNAVIAKSPTDGGVAALTLAMAFAREEGLPVTVVSGSGGRLSPVLVRSPEIGCLAFVGGKDTGGQIDYELIRVEKRHMIEQEGLHEWGIWDFSQWNLLAGHIKKGYEYGKQRCTAYPRFVVQRSLFDQFLETYIPVVDSLKVGNPLAVANADDPLPDVDFGPVINAAKARELNLKVEEAMAKGGIPLFRGELLDENFVPGQNRDAYFAPVSILNPPSSCALYHSEPFGPVDTVVIVDTPAEMLSAMNVSNGALVSSIACDNVELAKRLAEEVHAYKVGINAPRSRGDRDEPFGGRGASWKGAFVGGQYLVQAVTEGPAGERLYGNFPDYQLYPPA